MEIRAFAPADTETVVALWEECGLTRPWNDPRRDIERKLQVQPELFLVGTERVETADGGVQEAVVATAMAGHEGHRGWLYYVAVAPALRGGGRARALVAEAERLLTEAGCPKLQLMVRSGNDDALAAWSALGYERQDVVVLGKRLIED
ncbi:MULTISPECIES: GNAT family acetyltransferase [Frigoribacterium]|jgi:ribosomal protein S18 acetylase RimI-like enzyme|uniref:GNAT family acetyltransferase n=1 Tax=Frigoribacterium TaxID=96492 RepID=UPI001420F11E|nr:MULTISPECIES: GNAT family acetyltransferase [Frigoribacterium]MBD8729321.1 GNAT family acetyltransferase [Frigoribacterium sp. CFBP 13707]NII49614.1 ribosomal protein S18 acetylase RimI-like enzyme [Frigoribacterium endophyticum]